MTKVKVELPNSKAVEVDKQKNTDETDIYSDVLESHDANIEKLQQEIKKLRNEKSLLLKSLESLQKSYEKLQKEIGELESKYKTVAYNSSALFKTAQAEIARKDKTIHALRKEKDDLIFRRSSTVRTTSRLRRSVVVSPRKLRMPVKKRSALIQSPPCLEDSNSPKRGKENDIKTDSSLIVEVLSDDENNIEQASQREDVEVLPVQVNQEETLRPDPVNTNVPPALQGPITMYSKRLYKKIHGISPQKISPAMESSKLNVTHLPNLEASPPIAVSEQLLLEISDQKHDVDLHVKPFSSDLSKLDSQDLNKELSLSRLTHKQSPMEVAAQDCSKPTENNTPCLASKLKQDTQEFIKLGSSSKCCKTSPPQEVIIDLRKIPKENYNSAHIVREILNSSYGIKPGRRNRNDTKTKNTELGDLPSCGSRDVNVTPVKEVINDPIKTPEVVLSSPNSESNSPKDIIHRNFRETPRMNKHNRVRLNSSINKPLIAPVTFGRLVPHEPPKVIAQTNMSQGNSFVSQPEETPKRNSLLSSKNVLQASVQNPQGKKSSQLINLFGESPLKCDKLDVPILDENDPTPVFSLMSPNSSYLDSDDPEDLVIDTTAGSVNSSPRLSESDQKNENYQGAEVKMNLLTQNDLEVKNKISTKSTEDNIKPSTNTGNETGQSENKSSILQNTLNSKETSPSYGLPDLSDCFSLDYETQPAKKPRLMSNESHDVNLDACFSSQKLPMVAEPENKLQNFHSVCAKGELSTPPRFIPSPPELSAVSGLTQCENSLLNTAGDTMDLVSRLALSKIRDISPLRTPDKRNNTTTTEMPSPKSDPSNISAQVFSDFSSPDMNVLHGVEKIIQTLANSNGNGTEVADNASSDNVKSCNEKHLDTASADCLAEKTFISEQVQKKSPVLGDDSKFTQPQNEFKRRRSVRRLDPNTKIENKLITHSSNKENVESKTLQSTLSDDSSMKKIKMEERLEVSPTIGSNLINVHNEEPTSDSMSNSKSKPEYRLIPLDECSLIGTDKTQNKQINALLKPNVKSSSSTLHEMEHPNIVPIPEKQKHLSPENSNSKSGKKFSVLISQPNKKLNLTQVPDNLTTDVNKSTSEAISPQKNLKRENQDNLTPFLKELMDSKKVSCDVTSKTNQDINTNLQKQINTKNQLNIPTSKTVGLPALNGQKNIRVISRENAISKAKASGKKFPIKNPNIDAEEKTFKRSTSVNKMASAGVKCDTLNKIKTANEVLNDFSNKGCVKKQVENTLEELEKMPHISRIRQKVRISAYQGNKEQMSLSTLSSEDKSSPSKIKKDSLAKCTMPEPSFKPAVDKNIARIKRPSDSSSGKCQKLCRRSVSVDRAFISRKRQSPTGKKPRSKSNFRSNHDLIEPKSEHSLMRILSRSPSPLPKIKSQRHSRRSQSISPSKPKTLEKPRSKPNYLDSSRKIESPEPRTNQRSNPELIRCSSNSPKRKPRSTSNYVNRSRESVSPEQKINRRSYHHSRRMYNRSSAEEFKYRGRKISRSPPPRSHSRYYRERSPSPKYQRLNRYGNPRDRSRNPRERTRSRSPRFNRGRFPSRQTDEREIPQSSDLYRSNSKAQFSHGGKNIISESGADKAHKSCHQLSNDNSYHEEIIALRKELELLKGNLIKSTDEGQETELDHEKRNKMQSTEISQKGIRSRSGSPRHSHQVGQKGNVRSRSGSPYHSHQVKSLPHISYQPEVVQASSSQAKNDQIHDSSISKCSPSGSVNKSESLSSPSNSVTEITKLCIPTQVPIKRIKRKTRNLGDSEVNVVSATKIS